MRNFIFFNGTDGPDLNAFPSWRSVVVVVMGRRMVVNRTVRTHRPVEHLQLEEPAVPARVRARAGLRDAARRRGARADDRDLARLAGGRVLELFSNEIFEYAQR